MAPIFDENNQANKEMIKQLIKSAHDNGLKVGICGQGPSDSLPFTQFLVEQGIDSISFTPDLYLKGLAVISEAMVQHV